MPRRVVSTSGSSGIAHRRGHQLRTLPRRRAADNARGGPGVAGVARRSRHPVPSWYNNAMTKPSVSVTARRRELALDERGYRGWVVREEPVELQPATTALVLCDVWDHHWCRGAEERLEPLVPCIDRTARTARDLGMLVAHAPSDTMSFYAGHPARERVLQATPVTPPAERAHEDPPPPVDGSDSSDTARDPVPQVHPALVAPAPGGMDRRRA